MNQQLLEDVYAFIRRYIAAHHYPPTIREIAKGCYMTHGNVSRYLDRLEKAGRIFREPGQARGIWLSDENSELPKPD